jgi:hypothetical protein
MIDTLFTIGQAASAMLLAYGGFLVLMPVRRAPIQNRTREGEFLVRKQLLNDA